MQLKHSGIFFISLLSVAIFLLSSCGAETPKDIESTNPKGASELRTGQVYTIRDDFKRNVNHQSQYIKLIDKNKYIMMVSFATANQSEYEASHETPEILYGQGTYRINGRKYLLLGWDNWADVRFKYVWDVKKKKAASISFETYSNKFNRKPRSMKLTKIGNQYILLSSSKNPIQRADIFLPNSIDELRGLYNVQQ